MKVNAENFKSILQTLNRIDCNADVEFQGNHWDDAKDRTYKSLESISIEFAKEKHDNAKLIIKIS